MKQREAVNRRQEQERQLRAAEDRRMRSELAVYAQLDARRKERRAVATATESTIYTEDPSNCYSNAGNQIISHDELAQARRWLSTLGVGVAGAHHFSARPLVALGGTIALGKDALALRVTFSERPSDTSDIEAIRLALRCLALFAARAATIERACAVAAPPPDFICPITLGVMRDPVTADDGRAYERSAIAKWLTRRRTSPLTNCTISSAQLAPDDALRRRIDRWARSAAGPHPQHARLDPAAADRADASAAAAATASSALSGLTLG